MVDMTLKRLLNKGQGHSVWYQSPQYITLQSDRQTDDRRTQHCSISATLSTVG